MKINIGTSLGNIVGVDIDLPIEEINLKDIMPFVREKFGTQKLSIYGWCPWSDIQPIDLVGNLTDEEIEEL